MAESMHMYIRISKLIAFGRQVFIHIHSFKMRRNVAWISETVCTHTNTLKHATRIPFSRHAVCASFTPSAQMKHTYSHKRSGLDRVIERCAKMVHAQPDLYAYVLESVQAFMRD